jgi:hypothetical protein
MKIEKILMWCIFLLLLAEGIVYSVDMVTSITTTSDKFEYQELYDEMNATGLWTGANSLGNLTDGNKTSCAIPLNDSTYEVNYTRPGGNFDTLGTSLWEVTYNSSTSIVTENLTISTNCRTAYDDRFRFKIETNATMNITNEVTNESVTLLNATGVPLANARVIANIVVFNQTGILNLTNATYNTKPYNSTWGNNTNMTLYGEDITVYSLFNCTDPQNDTKGWNTIAATNYTVFASEGYVQSDSNDSVWYDGIQMCINYSYSTQTMGSANYTVDYATGNITLADNSIGNGSQWGINYTYYTDGDQTNSRWCHNSSHWVQIGTTSSSAMVCEEAMQFNIDGRNHNVTAQLSAPLGTTDSEYYTSTSTEVMFNFTYDDGYSDVNHTTLNATLYTRMTNTGNFTVNRTGIVVTNQTYSNISVQFDDGDRVWWYLGFEDNYSRPVLNQTPTRIIDIDADYYTLSLGSGDVINFSLSTGDITTIGDIRVIDLTATNLESNLDGTGFNLTTDITTMNKLFTNSINQTGGNATINMIHAEMWNYSANASAWTFPISVAGIYYNMTGLTPGNINGFDFTQGGATGGGSYLTTIIPGTYHIDALLSFETTGNNELYSVAISKNHVASNSRNCYDRVYMSVQAIVDSGTPDCLLDLAAGDTVALQVENEGGTADIKIHSANLHIFRTGD